MAMIGTQPSGNGGAAAPDVLIASARNPDGFEERLPGFCDARDAPAAAKGGAEQAQKELAATREALAKAEAELARSRAAPTRPSLSFEPARGSGERSAQSRRPTAPA